MHNKTLTESFAKSGSLLCLGIDPIANVIPKCFTGSNTKKIEDYFYAILEILINNKLSPSAFKLNIGYFDQYNDPKNNDFSGYITLNKIINWLKQEFIDIPWILDSKRGDIARSSLNYAHEAFSGWAADGVTVSPYMGSDSISPFIDYQKDNKLIYILNLTSNNGSEDIQKINFGDKKLYHIVANKIITWCKGNNNVGAVIGGNQTELASLLSIYKEHNLPILIPGVGKQGGTPQDVIKQIKQQKYPYQQVRINVSSGISYPWQDNNIFDWRTEVNNKLIYYHSALSIN